MNVETRINFSVTLYYRPTISHSLCTRRNKYMGWRQE